MILLCSGVGTMAAVAALAATLFRSQIDIHNLHTIIAKASLVPEAKFKQPASVSYAVTTCVNFR